MPAREATARFNVNGLNAAPKYLGEFIPTAAVARSINARQTNSGQRRCQATSSVTDRSLFFFEAMTGTLLGTIVHPRPQTSLENCTWHNFNVVPTDKRYVLVAGNYQSGISVVDFTDPAAATEVAFADPAPLVNPNNPAVISLALGIASLAGVVFILPFTLGLFFPVTLGLGIAAVVLGRNGMKKVDRGETPLHRSTAQAGLITGIIGTVLSAEPHPNADKLLLLQIDKRTDVKTPQHGFPDLPLNAPDLLLFSPELIKPHPATKFELHDAEVQKNFLALRNHFAKEALAQCN